MNKDTTDKIKKLGTKIYTNGKKIEEANRSGMTGRIQPLIEKTIEARNELTKILDCFASNNMENV